MILNEIKMTGYGIERHEHTYTTFYCELCDKFHHGHRGVCTYCGFPSDWDTMMVVDKEKAERIVKKYSTADDFVRGNLLKGIGAFNRPWTNERQLRLLYRVSCEIMSE